MEAAWTLDKADAKSAVFGVILSHGRGVPFSNAAWKKEDAFLPRNSDVKRDTN